MTVSVDCGVLSTVVVLVVSAEEDTELEAGHVAQGVPTVLTIVPGANYDTDDVKFW